jgi:hypothetical protein
MIKQLIYAMELAKELGAKRAIELKCKWCISFTINE